MNKYTFIIVLIIGISAAGILVGLIVNYVRKRKLLNSVQVGTILGKRMDLRNPFGTCRRCRKVCDIKKDVNGLTWYDYVECDKNGYCEYEMHYQMNEKNWFFDECVVVK